MIDRKKVDALKTAAQTRKAPRAQLLAAVEKAEADLAPFEQLIQSVRALAPVPSKDSTAIGVVARHLWSSPEEFSSLEGRAREILAEVRRQRDIMAMRRKTRDRPSEEHRHLWDRLTRAEGLLVEFLRIRDHLESRRVQRYGQWVVTWPSGLDGDLLNGVSMDTSQDDT